MTDVNTTDVEKSAQDTMDHLLNDRIGKTMAEKIVDAGRSSVARQSRDEYLYKSLGKRHP